MGEGPSEAIRAEAHRVLEGAWDTYRGYCFPNAVAYPHLWLWDSCFHAIAWASFGDLRGRRELHSALSAQFPGGFVPHMRYAGPTIDRGPLDHASSFTQPAMYGHAARLLVDRGLMGSDDLVVDQARLALSYLWRERTLEDGLLYIVHPWESGADDSPRWDDWVGATSWARQEWTVFDFEALQSTTFDDRGAATWSSRFVAAPVAFNAIAAHAVRELASIANPQFGRLADGLVAAIDGLLWDEREGLWSDLAVVGGEGGGVRVPTLDGVLGALVTADEDRAHRALDQLGDDSRFGAPYGLRYVAGDHPAYRPDQYWRGSAWMQMNYLAWLAARRWHRSDLVESISAMSIGGATESAFAEHWNPETGAAEGAVPQTWSALVAVMAEGGD